MNINEFLQSYRKVEYGTNVTRPRVACNDVYTVSVQAGFGIYSSPRTDSDHYTAVELGYPSKKDDELIPYAENAENPLCTVYGFVPVELVDKILQKLGGIVGADFSNDMAKKWKR